VRSEFAGTFRQRLESILEAFAKLVASRVPGVVWRVELPASRVYDLVAVVTFMYAEDRENEVVAVSLESHDMSEGSWKIDATDRESLPLDLDGEPMTESLAVDVSSVDAAARDIDERLRLWTERIVRELRP
jgi:hypothetical protein